MLQKREVVSIPRKKPRRSTNLFFVFINLAYYSVKEETIMKKTTVNKKLAGASAMLLLSASMLGTSTYAWFTMNKEVSVTGMEVKAHAEEGLLINEVSAANDTHWDEQATANTTPTTVVLRPASTSDLSAWWHANSKKSSDEAGMDALSDTVVVDSTNGYYYTNISVAQCEDNAIVTAAQAAGNSKAETHIYYKDASFGGDDDTYQDGEGFYVKYTYYLKSSGDEDLDVSNLQVKVKATKNATAGGSSDNLDPALRVGVIMPVSTAANAANSKALIFAPVTGADSPYDVTGALTGAAASKTSVTPITATTGDFSAYTTLNTATDGSADITIPSVTSAGIPVYVYVWFEGEDTHCNSDALTATLATYDIDVNFYDGDIY
jgi:hypothetical protein